MGGGVRERIECVREREIARTNSTNFFHLQVVRHELHITNQIMHLRPPVEMARCRLVGQLHEWVNTIAALSRIQSSRYQVREGGRKGRGWCGREEGERVVREGGRGEGGEGGRREGGEGGRREGGEGGRREGGEGGRREGGEGGRREGGEGGRREGGEGGRREGGEGGRREEGERVERVVREGEREEGVRERGW